MSNSSARVQLSNYLQGNGLGQRQYVKNPNAFRNTTEGITLGAGVSAGDVTRNTTTPITSISDFQIALNSATNEYVEWTLDTIDRADLNGNCQFSGAYKLSLGSGATVQAQVYQGSNLAASLNLAAASTATRFLINVPCGDGSSATTVRFAQTVAVTTSTLNVADLYYGRALNIGSADANTSWQSYTATIGATTTPPTPHASAVSSAMWRRVGDSMEIMYTFYQDSTGSAGSGTYLIPLPSGYTANTSKVLTDTAGYGARATVLGSARCANTATAAATTATDGHVVLHNSTNLKVVINSAASNELVVWSDSRQQLSLTNYTSFTARVPIQGWSSEVAYRPEQQAAGGQITWVGATSCQWTSASTSGGTYVDFAADADCNNPTVTGALTAPGTKVPEFTYNNMPVGSYLIIVRGDFGNGGANAGWRLSDGTNTYWLGSAAATSTATLTAQVTTTSVANRTYKLQWTSFGSASSGFIQNEFTGKSLQIQVIPLSQSLPVPLLVGSVTSNSTGAERIERVQVTTICTGSPCTIASQSGAWLTNITRSGTGVYSANFTAGMFSSPPSCLVMATGSPSLAVDVGNLSASPSSTAFTWTGYGSASGVPEDHRFNIVCMGPR